MILLKEGSIFAVDAATPEDVSTFFQDNYPKLTDNDTALILDHYPRQPAVPRHQAWFPTASLAYGEATFICPTVNVLAAISAAHGNASTAATAPRIFSYRYNVQDAENTADGLGVLHLFEAAAVFGPTSIGPVRLSYLTYNAAIVPVVMDYWISFVRALDPNVYRNAGAPLWEVWGGANRTTSPGRTRREVGSSWRRLVIETGVTRIEDVPADQLDRCDFWESLGRVTQQKVR